jgi:hypothetical protein
MISAQIRIRFEQLPAAWSARNHDRTGFLAGSKKSWQAGRRVPTLQVEETRMTKAWLAAIAAVSFAAGVPAMAVAQNAPVKIVSLMELSGAGATAGTNFSNGV